MAQSVTNIVSLSVMLLGHKPVISLENADDLVTSAIQAYDLLLPSAISAGNWRFAMRISQLSLSPMVPPLQSGWTSIYYLPSGYLKNIRVIPQNYVYEIYADNLIYTNWGTLTPVFMEHAFLPDVSQLPPWFVNYFIYEIAGFLGLSAAQKPDYYNVLEARRISQMAMASAIDAQNRPQFAQVDIPMLNNRNITGIIGPAIG